MYLRIRRMRIGRQCSGVRRCRAGNFRARGSRLRSEESIIDGRAARRIEHAHQPQALCSRISQTTRALIDISRSVCPSDPVLEKCGTAPNFTDITTSLNTPSSQRCTMKELRGKVVLVNFGPTRASTASERSPRRGLVPSAGAQSPAMWPGTACRPARPKSQSRPRSLQRPQLQWRRRRMQADGAAQKASISAAADAR